MARILNISDAASLALHGMAVLAVEDQKMVSVHQIASELNVSEAHLAKVFSRLARADLVRSIRGPKGGFMLSRPAGQIHLLEIYQAIEGPMAEGDCLFDRPLCSGKDCIFGSMLTKVHTLVSGYLARTKLSKLAKAYRSKIDAEKTDH